MAPIAAIACPLLSQGCHHCLDMLLSQEAMAKVFCLHCSIPRRLWPFRTTVAVMWIDTCPAVVP